MVIKQHTCAIFHKFVLWLWNNLVFLLPGVVEVVEEGMLPHVNLHETVIVTIEPCTSNISLCDTRDLAGL